MPKDIKLLPKDATPFYTHNQSAIRVAKSSTTPKRRKFIDFRHHYLTHQTQEQAIEIRHVQSQEILPDILTKPLTPQLFTHVAEQLGVCKPPRSPRCQISLQRREQCENTYNNAVATPLTTRLWQSPYAYTIINVTHLALSPTDDDARPYSWPREFENVWINEGSFHNHNHVLVKDASLGDWEWHDKKKMRFNFWWFWWLLNDFIVSSVSPCLIDMGFGFWRMLMKSTKCFSFLCYFSSELIMFSSLKLHPK